MLGPAQRHPAATARSGERARTRAWAGLARTRHGAVCRRGRSTPRRARDRRARRMPVHATTAMARRPCCCRTPQGRRPSCGGRARAGSRVGSAPRPGQGRQFQRTNFRKLCAGTLCWQDRARAGATLDSKYRSTRRDVPSGDFIPSAGVQPCSFPRDKLNRKVRLFP